MTKFLLKALRLIAGEPVGVQLSPIIKRNWTLDADFILDNVNKYNDKRVGRFAYNPKTFELVWDNEMTQHAIMIMNQSGSPFDDFVRGAYDGNTVYIRWYSTNPQATADEIQAESFDAWWSVKKMLEANGMPAGMEVKLGVDTQDLKNEMGSFYN